MLLTFLLFQAEEVSRRQNIYVIREIYESDNANEIFEQHLERALAQGCDIIVIEPFKLGDETARWIACGNWLHKTAVMSGFGAIVANFVWPQATLINGPLAFVSILCTGLYSLSWQFDPCCKYQVESDPRKLNDLALESLNNSSPVVLFKKDDNRRKVLHTAVSLACVVQIGLRWYYPSIYRIFNPTYSNYTPLGRSPTSAGGPPGQIVVTSYSRHNPETLPTSSSSGIFSVLAEGLGIFES